MTLESQRRIVGTSFFALLRQWFAFPGLSRSHLRLLLVLVLLVLRVVITIRLRQPHVIWVRVVRLSLAVCCSLLTRIFLVALTARDHTNEHYADAQQEIAETGCRNRTSLGHDALSFMSDQEAADSEKQVFGAAVRADVPNRGNGDRSEARKVGKEDKFAILSCNGSARAASHM